MCSSSVRQILIVFCSAFPSSCVSWMKQCVVVIGKLLKFLPELDWEGWFHNIVQVFKCAWFAVFHGGDASADWFCDISIQYGILSLFDYLVFGNNQVAVRVIHH